VPARQVAFSALRVYQIKNLVGFKSPEGSAYLDTTFSYDVELDVDKGVVVLTQFKGSSTIAILLVKAIRSSTVGKEYHYFVNRLRILREKILQNGSD
jgi:hypothetical protein